MRPRSSWNSQNPKQNWSYQLPQCPAPYPGALPTAFSVNTSWRDHLWSKAFENVYLLCPLWFQDAVSWTTQNSHEHRRKKPKELEQQLNNTRDGEPCLWVVQAFPSRSRSDCSSPKLTSSCASVKRQKRQVLSCVLLWEGETTSWESKSPICLWAGLYYKLLLKKASTAPPGMVQTYRPSGLGGAHKVNRYLTKTLQVIQAEKWGPGWVLSGKSIASSKPFLVSHTAHIFKVFKHIFFLRSRNSLYFFEPNAFPNLFSWEFLFISYRPAEKKVGPHLAVCPQLNNCPECPENSPGARQHFVQGVKLSNSKGRDSFGLINRKQRQVFLSGGLLFFLATPN